MNSSVATVADMLATDAETILALFSGKNQTQFINVLKSLEIRILVVLEDIKFLLILLNLS